MVHMDGSLKEGDRKAFINRALGGFLEVKSLLLSPKS